MKEPKFEVKPLEKKPEEPQPVTEGEPRQGREIETWEGEGGTVAAPSDLSPEDQKANEEASGEGRETEEEASAEVPETVVEEEQVKNAWQELVAQAKEEFPEDIKRIIDKAARKEKLTPKEMGALDSFSYHWFKEAFGIKVNKKQPQKELTPEELEKKKKREEADKERSKKRTIQKREKKGQLQLQKLAEQKKGRMEQLHRALRNLDAGESVQEFIDETRRVVYFDEENGQYFVEENGERKYLGIGDIVSDYAWGIKYFPDSGMTDPTAYRTLAKRILVNETRRDLEKIHNSELIIREPHRDSADAFIRRIWPKFTETSRKNKGKWTTEQDQLWGNYSGWIIEVAVRELISRIGLNANLDFVIYRATVQEDADFKYDFKLRVKRRVRGIDVQSHSMGSVGFQLKSEFKRSGVSVSSRQKREIVQTVDAILTLKVPNYIFQDAVKRWLGTGEPSGGPERFLSPELKKAILKAVTEKLVDIPQEIYDQIV